MRQTETEIEIQHLTVRPWVRSAIHAAQQLTSPIFETSASALRATGNTSGLVMDILSNVKSYILTLYLAFYLAVCLAHSVILQ
jgi:hypothetical protein